MHDHEHRIGRRMGAPATAILAMALAAPAMSGCTGGERDLVPATGTSQAELEFGKGKGKVIDLRRELPFVEPLEVAEVFIQKLREPTQLDENVALHVKLPPPAEKRLDGSLIRVIGQPESPLVLFSADMLAELGKIPESPGKDFFTTFVRLDAKELERRLKNEKKLESGKFGRPTETRIVFEGRTPVAVTTGIKFDFEKFDIGRPIGLGSCPVFPLSTPTAWGESLLITDPAVVQDRDRTWDPCTGDGAKGGAWTFAHLAREMAKGSGVTPEEFVTEWLTLWLNDYTVNDDLVSNRRAEMFSQVIAPWAVASGESASLVFDPFDNRFEPDLTGPLDLDIAPFRLLAIVNRIDLGETVDGPAGYGGGTTSRPVDAGELRFVFGVTQPSPWGGGSEGTCGLKDFTVIFEYGVPITGCSNVVDWAQDWTQLNTFGGFNASYLAHLESLTQSVVLHGAAPGKGNQNALNQIRTNENALGSPWELREFRLSDENPGAGTDTPSNGLLRAHTVAQTPDDGAYPPLSSATVDAYVFDRVLPGVALSGPCSAAHTLPYIYNGGEFRGGNSLISAGHWEAASVDPLVDAELCARHQFSLNTCNGCHLGDTGTSSTHISPTSGIPATLSGFLTGGGGGMGFAVPDSQFGAPDWIFADLDRRFDRLYKIAMCTECTTRVPVKPDFLDLIAELAGVVPVDPLPPLKHKFDVGPIVKVDQFERILDARIEFARPRDIESIPIDLVRSFQPRGH